jgi:hypothetical protein
MSLFPKALFGRLGFAHQCPGNKPKISACACGELEACLGADLSYGHAFCRGPSEFCMVGHASWGKTTLSEAMLACAGVIGRMGNIAQGTTVSDCHVSEKQHQISTQTSLLHCTWMSKKLNILDTSGYLDLMSRLQPFGIYWSSISDFEARRLLRQNARHRRERAPGTGPMLVSSLRRYQAVPLSKPGIDLCTPDFLSRSVRY